MTNQQESKKKTITYQVTKNAEKMVAIWEHVDTSGIKRVETAIVDISMPIANLSHLQNALDASLGAGKGHSTMKIKPSYSVTIESEG